MPYPPPTLASVVLELPRPAHSDRSVAIAAARDALPPSACPGLFRLVPERDGALCRIKIPFGQLAAEQASALAAAATRFGSGVVEVTNRANLQIRGVRDGAETALIACLLDAGLGPRHPAADDIRNVTVSPTAGIDPAQAIDALTLAAMLLDYLETDARCHALSPKFSFLVDGGEQTAMVDHPHDIWLASSGEGIVVLGFASCPANPGPVVLMPQARAIEAIRFALTQFLDDAAQLEDVTRFKQLFATVPRLTWLDTFARRIGATMRTDWRRRAPLPFSHIGRGAQRQPDRCFVGMVPPVGCMTAATLAKVADLADECASGQIRLTPWQSVLLPNIAILDTARVEGEAEALGLICSADHSLARIVACSGSTGCSRGNADTRADALILADGLDEPHAVHLTGCGKSCALPYAAETTLVATASGTYDVFRRAAGADSRFGRLIARNLSVAEAASRLRAIE